MNVRATYTHAESVGYADYNVSHRGAQSLARLLEFAPTGQPHYNGSMDIANFLITVFYFVIVLGVLVLVHEIGHYMFAKRFGVRVEEFGIGYPPRALKLWKERGWVQIQSRKIEIPRRFALPAGVQIGSWVNYKTSMENGREVLASIAPVDVAQRGLAAASQVQELDPGTIYTLNWLPLGGFVRMTGEENPSDPLSFAAKRPLVRGIILVAGAGMNVLLAIVLFSIIAAVGQPKPIEKVLVADVAPNSPAALAGLQANDVIVSVDGIKIENREDLLQATYDRTGQPVTLLVQRGSNTVSATLTPRVNPPKGEGPMGIRLDATPIREDYVSYPIWQAIPVGVARTWDTATAIFTGFRRLAQGTAPQGSVSGPVEIGRVTGIACQAGILSCMAFTGLLSVNLAIINLFPFPALDGGRLMFVILEGLRRGKRIAPEKEGLVHFVGMAILLLLMVLISFNDVMRLFGIG